MKAIYLDTFAGISGNMLLGALIDAGFPISVLQEELAKLHLGEYKLVYNKVNKLGIEATYFNVELPHEHHHKHEHDHDNAHSHAHHHHHEHRNLQDIMQIINASALSESIKAKAYQVFLAIAKAEAKVHGKAVDEVHFHEVGAIDTIIDIVGCLLGLEYLQIEKIYHSIVTTGYGFVECAHGTMPVPAPATAELLCDIPQQRGIVDKEMTTPTGAALLRVLAEYRGDIPVELKNAKVFYGAGTREVIIPNVLRMYLGDIEIQNNSVIEAACNIDNMSSEVLAYTMQKLLNAGVLDAWIENIVMKKGRAAHKLVFLVEEQQLAEMLEIIFAETTTLGVRYEKKARVVLERKFIDVATEYGAVKVKLAFYEGKLVNIAPEYEACKALAEAKNISLKKVMDSAYLAARGSIDE